MSRALWAGAAGGTAELCLLAARADAAARRAGAPMSEPRHRYRPHLTPARDRKGAHVDLQPYAEALRGFEGGAWEVGELALVHSRLPVSREPPAPGGAGAPGERPSYETIARCRLGRSWRGHDPPGDGTVGGGR
ncbi:2'-5' RNA ligase family protein [Streptomyces corynorhini]|uniref:Phosphoesterase HXTX domain-containing protein n=1 Tax=Streptomyces corynorhini TaxID=2282652 RepID=A0A370BB36_9ACTN|nr:hypothetical protein DVH02_05990 [Streptomyces corynorhini]